MRDPATDALEKATRPTSGQVSVMDALVKMQLDVRRDALEDALLATLEARAQGLPMGPYHRVVWNAAIDDVAARIRALIPKAPTDG